MNTQNKINPREFAYTENAKVEMDGQLLMALIDFLGKVVDENSKYYTTDKFKFINPATDKEVKNPKTEDIESGKVVKVPDIEKTLMSEPKFYRNRTALEAINLIVHLQEVNMNNIKEGKAVNIKEYEDKVAEEVQNLEEEKKELILD